MNSDNFPISRLLRSVTAVECLVLLISGGGLFFLPDVLGPGWPWPLTPFNTRFLGAAYLGSLVSTLVLVWRPYWSPARVVVPMISLFTLVVLGVSLTNLARFTQNGLSTIGWFVLYIGIPANALYHLWLYRAQPAVSGIGQPRPLRFLLTVQVALLGVYGALLLVAPAFASGFWPWTIDDFHARMYSAGFLTPALGALLLLRSGTALEFRALGLTQAIAGSFALGGLLIVNSAVQRVDWTLPGTWAWIALFLYIAASGAAMLGYARSP
ncbi:MAG: hypothetical protein IPK52_22675 [Chloroflexi bacterium]|nr:hypothetical protein [Chloroflexota bacterium]